MKMKVIGVSKENHLDTKFMEAADNLSHLLLGFGIPCKPYTKGLPLFSLLPDEKKITAISHIEFYNNLCLEEIAEGYSLKDSPSFTWRALRHFGYTPTSDLFDKIKNEHIIEIYDFNGLQVFRNLKYFDFCSYTLEELYSLEWYRLYDRPTELTALTSEAVGKIYSGEKVGNFDPQIPKHIVKEALSSDLLSMEYAMDWMGPLFQNRKPVAVIVLESARLIT